MYTQLICRLNSSRIIGFGVLGLVGSYPVYERSVISVGVAAACSVLL